MSIHDGHRQRLKSRFIDHGLESFSDIEALELLLFYALPRCDTNETAHHLLNSFKSLSRVLEADVEDLKKIEGVGENAATLIKLVTSINKRYLTSDNTPGVILQNSEDVGNFLIPYYAYAKEELAYLITLDSKCEVISCHELARGIMNRVDISARMIVDLALKDNAVGVVLSHNHVSGNCLPSNSDLSATKTLNKALTMIGIILRDHIIVSKDDFVSLRDSGFFIDI